MPNGARCLFLAAVVVAAAAAAGRAAVVVCPPQAYPSTDVWRAAAADADRVQRLLDDHGTALMATDDGGLLSVRQAAVTSAPPRLAADVDAKVGAAAADALAAVRARPDRTPADLCAVAARYPLTRAAADARAAAGRRAVEQGDLDAAAALAGTPPLASAVGPLPFDADWHATFTDFGGPRDVPVGSAAVAFVADRERGVVALDVAGRLLWRYAAPPSAAVASAYHPGDTGRGPLSVPAVLADDGGRPQLVVARIGSGLTALRASDGRPFWTTAGDPAWAATAVLSSPAVAGRCAAVVAVAADDPDQPDAGTLQVVAVDVMDGRVMWRCPLGPVSDPLRVQAQRMRQREPEPFRDGVPPTFAGELIVAADNAGAVVAIDRFGGDVRWARPYAPAATDGQTARHFNNGINRGLGVLPPLPSAALLRWTGAAVVAGDVVFVAPQDAAVAMGLDRRTGRLLWQTTALPEDATCAGAAGGRFILAGAAVAGVDPATGAVAWSAAPPGGAAVTGPAVVRGDAIWVRTSGGLMAVSAADGSFRPAAAGTADFGPIAASAAGRAALAAAGMGGRVGR